jgi:agmatinase
MFNVNDIRRMGINEVVERLKSGIVDYKKTYLTVDIDVFDPAYAPAVGNPEADGLAPDTVLTMVNEICDDRIAGLDLVEITPHYDTGITAALGARVIFEALCAIEKSRGATGVQA